MQSKLQTLLCAALSLLAVSANAANVTKANNTTALNDPTSWSGGATPTSADVAVWDSTVTAANSVALGASTNWAGIKLTNPGGAVSITTGNVLSLGASGIDMSLATTNLSLANSNILIAPQTWNVASGTTLTVSGGVTNTAGSVLTVTGGGTVVLSGTGSGASGLVNNGAIVQMTSATGSGTGAITNNNGSTFRINTTTTLANAMNFNGIVTMDLNNVGGNQGIGSPGAISGSGTLIFSNQNAAAVRTFTLGGSSSSLANFSGTVNLGTNGGVFRFNDGGGSGNTGSSAMTMDLGTGPATFFSRNRGAAVNFGALFGGSTTKITQGSSSSGISTYTIGGKNTPCQFDGTIQDGGSAAGVAITKTGTSTFTLTANNTYFGVTTVSGGTLQVGNGGGTGSVGTGAIVNNATLVYNRTGAFTVANAISGSGTTIQQGGGVLTFSGPNTSSGTLLVSTGTVAVAVGGSISGPISIATNAIFDVSTNPAFAFNQTVSGNGAIVGAATNIGGTISPGGAGAAGTLTYSNGLAETGGVNHQLELSAPAGPNDLINIVGDFNVSGLNAIALTKLGGGTLANGVYPLVSYTGNFIGDLTNNFSVTASGVTATLTNPANLIAVVISPAIRGATNLTWLGDGAGNIWDVDTTSNWVSGVTSFSFKSGDKVRFDSTGAANNTVNLSSLTALLPAAVVVDAANDYTFTGNGAISGTTGLTKTNTGTLFIQTTNKYDGPTVVGQGVLDINNIANGNADSAIGKSTSDPTNLVVMDSTLRYSGPSTSTDRGATLSGSGGTIDIPSGTLTLTTAPLTGAGALTKNGGGTLTLNVANTYAGGTVVSNGVLALGANAANSDGAGGSGVGATNKAVTFDGGTLQLFGYNGSTGLPGYSTFFNPLIVPAGQTGTLRMVSRGNLASPLSGSGTLNLVVNYVRGENQGNWSAFSGTINVTGKAVSGDEFRVNNNFGYSNAVIILNDGVLMDRTGSANSTIDIGELQGTGLAVIGQGNGSSAAPNWRVGWKGTSSTFAGTLANDVSLTKVGNGTLTLSGANTHTGNTTVSAGTLALSGSGSLASSTTIDVQSGAFLDLTGISPTTLALNGSQTLKGNGTVTGDVDSSGGGNIAPGESIGKLTVTGTATLAGNFTVELNRTNSVLTNDVLAAANIVLGGTLTVTNIGPTLQAGDRFVLFQGPFTGAFSTVNLPENLGGTTYTWTNKTAIDGSIQVLTVVSVNTDPTNIVTSVSGNTLTLSWPADHTGWRLQSQTNTLNDGLGANWTDIPGTGASNTYNATIDPANGTVFYRLVYP